MTARLPHLLALGAFALVALAALAWAARGEAILVDLAWLGCF